MYEIRRQIDERNSKTIRRNLRVGLVSVANPTKFNHYREHHRKYQTMIDHDGKFKRLLSKYFLEFIDLFFPDLVDYLERDSIALLDKELYETSQDKRGHADLVFRAKVRNKESFS